MIPRPSNHSDSYKKRILKKRDEVLKGLNKELNETIGKAAELKASLGSDTGDMSALNLDSHLSVSFARRYSSMLRQIDQALRRVDEGSYGICEECGERIDKKRLNILPFTLYCTRCQSRIEQESRRASRLN
ncbi:MAG: TraR/DksA family transcriptional regulator [Thermodesulfobacteriota bacterium]